MLRLEYVMWALLPHGSGGLLVIGIPLRSLLFLMPSSRCVRSNVTLHEHFVWNKDRTTSVAPMFGMVLLAAVAVAGVAGAVVWALVAKYGYKVVPYWPFLLR